MLRALFKFADFELDCFRYELRRKGHPLKLEKIPMELLLLLAESDGRLVSREEIEERLWGKEVFVDAEHGINTAIRKIRQVLGDDPDNRASCKTVQRKGIGSSPKSARFLTFRRAQRNRDRSGTRQPIGALAAETRSVGRAPAERFRLSSCHGKTDTAENPCTPRDLLDGRRRGRPAVNLAGLQFTLSRLTRSVSRSPRSGPSPSCPGNLSGGAADEYFADGMTDELITTLAKYKSLRVISRTSIMQYKKVHRPLPDIARELAVDGIVEGSVSRSQNRVRVTAQLVYAPTDTHLWAESYDRDLSDVLSMQQDLARSIAERVNVASSPPNNSPKLARVSVNPAARDAYLRGRYYWFF